MWFCKHQWQIIADTVTKRRFEIVNSAMTGTKKLKVSHDADSMLRRKHIQLLHCTKCGKLKRYVENI